MKTKRKILSLAISALLTAGVASYTMPSYAGNDSSTKNKVETKKKEDSSKGGTPVAHSDSNKRSTSDSGNKSHQKITVCHVPPGNPANKHTIHIAYSAWAAHKEHKNNIGPDYVDYLGSCNSKTTSTAKESLHVISGCTGTTRETLETKAQTYYEPITVADTALDDESVVTAMSQCMDKGDSSDSSDNDRGKAKGGGHDSVSDSGNHHRIRGCQDKSTTDSSKKYNTRLKNADSSHDTTHHTKDPIVVSDSSLDDSSVWTAYKACTQDSSNANKIDSSKISKKVGDSGHRQHVLRDHDSVSDSGKQHHKSCTDTQDQTLRTAITAYKAKTSTKDIILTASSYNDVTVKAAVDACVRAGATDTVTDSFSPNVAIPGVTITHATVTNATITDGVITSGTITAGTGDIANVIGGTISAGTIVSETTTSGTTTDGTTTGGTTTGGTTTDGTTTGGTTTDGTSTSGTTTDGTSIGGTTTDGTSTSETTTGTVTGTTITDKTITGATVSTGVSGRLNFRENTSPIKDETKTTTTTTTN
ncbi:MAG: hypothetical protein WAW41_02185 [Methylobacter sp.]